MSLKYLLEKHLETMGYIYIILYNIYIYILYLIYLVEKTWKQGCIIFPRGESHLPVILHSPWLLQVRKNRRFLIGWGQSSIGFPVSLFSSENWLFSGFTFAGNMVSILFLVVRSQVLLLEIAFVAIHSH